MVLVFLFWFCIRGNCVWGCRVLVWFICLKVGVFFVVVVFIGIYVIIIDSSIDCVLGFLICVLF